MTKGYKMVHVVILGCVPMLRAVDRLRCSMDLRSKANGNQSILEAPGVFIDHRICVDARAFVREMIAEC